MVTKIVKKLWMNNFTLHWIPGHAGFPGSGGADKLAKAATRSESDEPLQRDGHLWYLVTQTFKKAGIIAGSLLLRRLETGRFTKKIDTVLHLGKSAG